MKIDGRQAQVLPESRVAVYIGRFQPLHYGHLMEMVAYTHQAGRLIVVVGSANAEPSLRNPWGFLTRKDLILESLPSYCRGRVLVTSVDDHPESDDAWVKDVESSVEDMLGVFRSADPSPLAPVLAGIGKDSVTANYLGWLGQRWGFLDQDRKVRIDLNATDIRNSFFRGDPDHVWAPYVPGPVADYLREYRYSTLYSVISKQLLDSTAATMAAALPSTK